jgi:hypothetical protein
LGFAALLAGNLRQQLLQSRAVLVLGHLPIADTAFFRAQLKEYALSSVFVPYFLAPGYGYFAWSQGFSVSGWVAAATLALLQWPLFVAVTLLLLGRGPAKALAAVGGTLMMASSVVGFAGPVLPPLGIDIGWLGLLVLPTGWINGAFYFGLVEGRAEGWLLLVPALGVIVLAARRAAQPFAIQELSYSSGGHVIQAIPRKDWSLGPRLAGVAAEAPDRPYSDHPVPSLAKIAERVRQRKFLAPPEWESSGWVERCLVRCLSRRERALAEFLLGGQRPRWTLFWQLEVLWMAVCLAILAIPVPPEWVKFLCWAAFFSLVYPKVLLVMMPPVGVAGAVSGQAVLPVSYREVSRVLLKWAVVKNLVLLLPLAAVYGAAAAWRWGAPALFGLLVAMKIVYVLLTLLPWSIMFYFDSGMDDITVRPLRRGLFLGAVVLVKLAYLGAWYLLFQPSALPALAGAVLLAGCAAGAWRLYEYVLYRMRVDWG